MRALGWRILRATHWERGAEKLDTAPIPTDRLRDALERAGRVVFAYVFGSTARGRPTPESDLDVAVWIEDGLDAPDWAYRSLLPDLMAAARSDAVDLTVLNEAPPALRFTVQHTGEVIFERDAPGRAARVEFEQRARKDYWDFRPRLEEYAEFLRRRLERGRLGA